MGINRRTFVAGTAAGLATAAAARRAAANEAGRTVVLALMGAHSRGSQLAEGFSKLSGVEFAYVCDPDERGLAKGIDAATFGDRRPRGVKDFREALDDPAVDGLVCAAPNHWHAAATVLACAAGKHVYVEKPASQTPDEGQRMIAAVQASGKAVQVGMQRRSGSLYRDAIERVRQGAIGDVLLARSWYFRDRPSIGRRQPEAPPAWLDYNLWQGPAPEEPYRENILPYHWHNFWHWGNGELGNNGVHTVDRCRGPRGGAAPRRVTAAGGRYRYDDDQQTPDTMSVSWEFDGRTIVWDGLSWSPALAKTPAVGVELRGTTGTMRIDDGGCTLYDGAGKVVETVDGSRGDAEHLQNFLDAVRGDAQVQAPIAEGAASALLCHLGNIAYRAGRPVEVNPDGRPADAALTAAYWAREYRPGWMPETVAAADAERRAS